MCVSTSSQWTLHCEETNMFWVRRCWINKKSLSFKIVKMNYPFGVLLRIEHPLGTTVQPTPERRHWRSGRVKATAYTLAYSLRTGNNQHCSTLPRHWSLPFFSQHTPAAAGNIACQGLTKPQSWYKLSCLCSGDRDEKQKELHSLICHRMGYSWITMSFRRFTTIIWHG